jgi:hypothetical protein
MALSCELIQARPKLHEQRFDQASTRIQKPHGICLCLVGKTQVVA